MYRLSIFMLLLLISCDQKNSSNELTASDTKNHNQTEIQEKLNNSNVNAELDFLFDRFSPPIVYQAIFCIGKEDGLKFAKNIDWSDISYTVDTLSNKKDILIQIINLSNQDKNILRRINNFCNLSITLKTPFLFDVNEPFYFEELIYELDATKGLVTTFFNHSSQSWESLSSSQQEELYFKTVLYLTSLKPEKQLKYLEDYYALAKRKAQIQFEE